MAPQLCSSPDASLVTVEQVDSDRNDTVIYRVTGELSLPRVTTLSISSTTAMTPHHTVIDLSDAHIWDASSVAALDAVRTKYQAKGKYAQIVGLNADSADRHGRLSGTFGAQP